MMSTFRIFEKTPKKKKPTAKQLKLRAEWEAMLKKYEPKGEVKPKKRKTLDYDLKVPENRSTKHIPSHEIPEGYATKAPDKVYTGDKVIGVAVMHKSSLVPVFSKESAVDIAKMRRN